MRKREKANDQDVWKQDRNLMYTHTHTLTNINFILLYVSSENDFIFRNFFFLSFNYYSKFCSILAFFLNIQPIIKSFDDEDFNLQISLLFFLLLFLNISLNVFINIIIKGSFFNVISIFVVGCFQWMMSFIDGCDVDVENDDDDGVDDG